MSRTSVVFVHGFISGPECWDPFVNRLEKDADLPADLYTFLRFPYPTEFIEWNPAKRIASINDCGSNLALFLETHCKSGPIILVGHSMGGLVIQSMLAQKIKAHGGKDLARIRSVILFATPNRGSIIISTARNIFTRLRSNPQEEDLKVLNPDVAENSSIVEESIVHATEVSSDACPISFRVFWGSDDNVVPAVSARGSFLEASCLPGGHSEIIQCDPIDPSKVTDPSILKTLKDPQDQRYLALKSAILTPVGHACIYELDLLEISLVIAPVSPDTTFVINKLDNPKPIHTDNVATRVMKFVFSEQNRCRIPFKKTYRSDDGFVDVLELTEPNRAQPDDQSEYSSAGKKFTYVFTPDKGETFLMKLKIYNGFAAGQRQWHDHVPANAIHRLMRFTLDLRAYHAAGFGLDPAPSFFYRPQNAVDSTIRSDTDPATLQPPLPSADPWLLTWELANVTGGAVHVVWDVRRFADA